MHHPHLQRRWCYCCSSCPGIQLLSSCPGQLPNLLTSKCDFILVKAELINPKPKSRKLQRAGKKPKPQILYSCFQTTCSVLAYLFTMAIKTGAQQPSEGSTNQCCAPAVLCLGTLLWNADRALSLLWAGHWTTDFPKSPSIWMSLHFRNIRKEVSDWHTHKDATHGTLLVPSHYKILEHLMVSFLSAKVW